MRNFENLKIAVAGTGYVGLSIVTLLSQHHQVVAVDIIPEKVELINNKISSIQDEYIENTWQKKELHLTATLDAEAAYKEADFVVIAAPTNYDSKKNFFDTSAVETVIKSVIEYNPEAVMVIKSTVPVGFTAFVREKYHCDNIIFSPEFLRESKALYDNLYPPRIIVGTHVKNKRYWEFVIDKETFIERKLACIKKEEASLEEPERLQDALRESDSRNVKDFYKFWISFKEFIMEYDDKNNRILHVLIC